MNPSGPASADRSGPDTTDSDLSGFPEVLRAFLEAERAAGNPVASVFNGFPAPPVGACALLTHPARSRPRATGGGLEYRARASSISSGEFTDAERHFFVVEPPEPPEPFPDMDALRRQGGDAKGAVGCGASSSTGRSRVDRFREACRPGFDRWHDGTGPDPALLEEATPDELREMEAVLLRQASHDAVDVEVLAVFAERGSIAAREALCRAFRAGDLRVGAAVLASAPGLMDAAERDAFLIAAVRSGRIGDGLGAVLDGIAPDSASEVLRILPDEAVRRGGPEGFHLAAAWAAAHGAGSAMDPEWRTLFLRFTDGDVASRREALRQLNRLLGIP